MPHTDSSAFDRRLQGSNVSAFALHPGAVDTPLVRQLLPPYLTDIIIATCSWLQILKSPDQVRLLNIRKFSPGMVRGEHLVCFVLQGASTPVYAATAPELDGRSGAYLADCRSVQPKKGSQDPAEAARLWQVTFDQLKAAKVADAALSHPAT